MTSAGLIETARGCGAHKAAVTPVQKLVLSPTFQSMCQRNACGFYGKCWMCPPEVDKIEGLMAQISAFTLGLWYQTVFTLKDSFDAEGMAAGVAAHTRVGIKLQQTIGASWKAPMLHLGCGGCHVCKICAKQINQPCRYPKIAIASLESHGVDVYQSTQGTGLAYRNGENTATFFGLVLLKEG